MSIRKIVTRSIAGLLALVGLWAFGRDPSGFLESIGGWLNVVGVTGVWLGLATYAVAGLRPANQVLALFGGSGREKLDSPENDQSLTDQRKGSERLPSDRDRP